MSESSTKTKKAVTKKNTSSKKTAQKHDLLYIMSNSCGWCTKANPVVEELVKDGYKITTLDVMNPDEGKRANEIKSKHNAQCGTPLFLDAETGNQICGFRERDVLEKWAKGEEIPKPPQPKSPPPPPPQDLGNKEQVDTFSGKYETWVKENSHLPNLLSIDQVMERLIQSRERQANPGIQQPQGGPQGAPQGAPQNVNSPGTANQAYQPNYNMNHYYVVIDGTRNVVVGNPNVISGLKQQYFFQEPDGRLSKVVGDTAWDQNQGTRLSELSAQTSRPTGGQVAQRPGTQPGTHPAKAVNVPTTKDVSKAVQGKIADVKKTSEAKKVATEKKSKTNKKTIKGL